MTVDEILNDLLASVPEEYDTSVGSFFYDHFYPVAEWLYFLQNKINELENNAFALTASGEYLDRKVAEQGITRRQSSYAKGTVRIYGNHGEIVRQNSKVAADNILFAVDKTVSIPQNGYVDVTATCVVGGSVGNVKKGEINRFPVTLPGLTAVENITDFTGGYNAETDKDLLERYIEKVSRPNVSGNKYHYIEWAKEVTGVGDAQVIPLWNGAGTVKVVIVDLDNQPASAELIDAVKSHIEENRPIGANVTVVAATALKLKITLTLVSEDKTGLSDKISAVVKDYLTEVALNKSYISYAQIGSLILSVDGIDDYRNLKINGGTSNITLATGTVPVLESVVVS